jgi:hypothetical protein
MAPWLVPEMGAWHRRPLVIPPDSLRAWLKLAVWEMWMGVLVCMAVGFGVQQILSAPHRVFTIYDFTNCYATPVVLPCERVAYRGGALNVVFTFMCGVLLLVIAAWLLWELWMAAKPKPITDDFLKLLDDSFGRSWRNPRTWPWARVAWAYGFTTVGAMSIAGVALALWTLASASRAVHPPAVRVGTSQSFRVDRGAP